MLQQRVTSVHPPLSRVRSRRKPIVDLLVVSATDLVWVSERQIQLVQRISDLARGTRRSSIQTQGIWILLMIHPSSENADELEVAKQFSTAANSARFPWIWGVSLVKESSRENTGHAALWLHRLRFPNVKDKYRPNYILVLGSANEKNFQVHTPVDGG